AGLRFAAGLHRLFAPPEYVRGYPGMSSAAADALLAVHRAGRGLVGPFGRAGRTQMPPTAAHAAADLLLASPVLAADDPNQSAQLLAPLAAVEAQLLEGEGHGGRRRDRTWRMDRPEILDRVWRA